MTTMTTTPTPSRQSEGCPQWCHLPESRHAIDLQNGRAVIDHDGPSFGPYISAGGMTFAETGEVAELDVRIRGDIECRDSFTPADLRQLASDAMAAAAWLEAWQ